MRAGTIADVRVLIFHGYLLRGTGSNVYNAKLAEALRRAGHEVHLLCQDPDPASLPWGDAVGRWGGAGPPPPRGAPRGVAAGGRGGGGERRGGVAGEPVRATVYRPDIGRLLPVY